MRYRPFLSFCREHFVNSDGNIQDARANTKEAKKWRAKRRHGDLIYKLEITQKRLKSLYKKGDKALEVGDDPTSILSNAKKLEVYVSKIKRELKRHERRNGQKS